MCVCVREKKRETVSSGVLVVKITISFVIFDQILTVKQNGGRKPESGDGDAISNGITGNSI